MNDSVEPTLRGTVYRETLRAPWWWYPIAAAVAAVIAAEFHLGGIPITDWLPYVVLIPGFIVVVWAFGRGRLEIIDGELRVRGARLPLSVCSGCVALDAETLRRVVGREGDPSAFIAIRPYIHSGVQFWVDDPEDPTPYWVIGTRHPQRVVTLVRGAL